MAKFWVSKYEKCNGDVDRVDYTIEAATPDDAMELARQRFAGTWGVGTLQFEGEIQP